MSEGAEGQGKFVKRYNGKMPGTERREGSRYPEKNVATEQKKSRYPEKNTVSGKGRSRYPDKNVLPEQGKGQGRSRYPEKMPVPGSEAGAADRNRRTVSNEKAESAARREKTAAGSKTAEAASKRQAVSERKEDVVSVKGALLSGKKESSKSGTKGSLNQDTSWQERLSERKKHKLRIAMYSFLGVLAVVYIGVAVYFGRHFYEDTVIYGIDCSQKTVEEVKEEVADKLGDYTLTLVERQNIQEQITAEQIGLRFADNNSIDRMLRAQRSYLWPVMILMERSELASVAFTYDQEKTRESLERLKCFDDNFTVKPQDAYIGNTAEGFEVVPEVMGTTLDKEKALKAVCAALDKGEQSVSFEENKCYLNPEVYQDNEELVADTAAMNQLVRAHITYDFGDREEVVDASVMRDWIVELADGTFVIDNVKVEEYVTGLAEKYDTFGMTRDFYTSYGTMVTLTGGDYGWTIDQDATTLELVKAINEGYQGEMEPEYIYTAMSRAENDIGYTYVEICISQQRMLCYKDGVLIVDTPVVTGNPNKGNATPAGSVWAIDAKMRNYTLVGEGYRAPVDYWMPFNGDIGIHDLKSRAYFGGSIYLSNGSHGCVNTPYAQVAAIYDAVSVGTPVIVYDYP
ncbi:MAG: peptidoglycan binding domain-containing protein [Lachnospiraceae bacterium]|nr:peptidoglycan binding domain-containing protein [Lachnospiraceae bacterium]